MLSDTTEFGGNPRFEIVRKLGAGGLGLLYEAHDKERNERVALKTVRRLSQAEYLRLEREFHALREVRHPNLVTLYELLEEAGRWFFTMELIDGVSFLDYVRSSGPGAVRTVPGPAPGPAYDEARLRSALGQLARGVAAIHRAGKVHRDVKSSNILVTPAGRVVLLDYGFVTTTALEEQSGSDEPVGTIAYMAPEQAAAQRVGPEADWYSVGVVLFEALTGRLPFAGTPLQIMTQKQETEPPAPRTIRPSVPSDLDALCVDLLRIEPRARPTAAQIFKALGLGDELQASGMTTAAAGTEEQPFVGRQAELGVLRDALKAARGRRAVAVLVQGESGVGKSALVRRFQRSLAETGAVVLEGSCYGGEAVTYKAVEGVVESLSGYMVGLTDVEATALLPRGVGVLGEVFPVLRRVRALAQAPRTEPEHRIDPHERRTRLFAAMRELISRLADRRPVVIVIDDLQWADADSLALLGEVLRPPEAPAVLLIGNIRSGEARTAEAVLAGMRSVPADLRRVTVERLPREDARQLAEQLLKLGAGSATPPGAGSADAIVAEGGGHPLFIDELVRHVAAHRGQTADVPRLQEALWGRIVALTPDERRVLEAVAVAGRPLQQAVVAFAVALGPREFATSVEALRLGSLVRTTGALDGDTMVPYHDQVREAVLGHLDAEARRAVHGELAVALEAHGRADPELLALHWEGAGDNGRAATCAERAARQARETLAFEQAAALYRTALRLGDYGSDERAKLLMELAGALAYAGRGVEAADAYLEARPLASGAERRECQRRAAEQLLFSGHLERGLKEIEAALTEVGEYLPRTPRRALLSVLWQRARLTLRGLKWVERRESEIRGLDLVKHDTVKAVALGLGVVDTIRASDFQARCLRLALQAGERLRVGRAIAHEAMFVVTQGGRSIARAQALAAEAHRIADQSGQPYLLAWAGAASGLVAYFAARNPEAVQFLREAEARFREQTIGTTWEIDNVRLFLVLSLRNMGTLGELSILADAWVLDAARRGDRYAETTLARVANLIWLGRDDPEQARRELEGRVWTPPSGGYHLQHWYEVRAIVERQIYAGDTAGLAERVRAALEGLARSLLLRVQIVRCEVRWLYGRVALVRAQAGDGREAALRLAAQMAGLIEREDAPFARVWGGLLRAGLLAQQGQKAAAAARLEEVIRDAAEPSMLLCAAVARRRRGEILAGEEGAALVQTANAWMAGQGVRNPGRIMEVMAPGFGRTGTTW